MQTSDTAVEAPAPDGSRVSPDFIPRVPSSRTPLGRLRAERFEAMVAEVRREAER